MGRKKGSPIIKSLVRRLITGTVLQNADVTRQDMAELLQDIIGQQGEISPSIETLQKLISRIRSQSIKPIDDPWSIGCLSAFPIAADALPSVLDVYKMVIESNLTSNKIQDMKTHYLNNPNNYLSIRVALWVARLYKAQPNISKLYDMAKIYALEEQIDEILNTKPSTFVLDHNFIRSRLDGSIVDMPKPYNSPLKLTSVFNKRNLKDFVYYRPDNYDTEVDDARTYKKAIRK